MKRLLKRILLFAGFFVVFYLVIMFVVASTTPFNADIEKFVFTNPTEVGSNYERTIELDGWISSKHNAGTAGLILGSSTLYRNVDPQILSEKTGIDFFCAASSNQCLANSLYILEYCLSTGKKIDHLFLGVDHVLWNLDGLECSTDWIVNNYRPQRKYIFQMAAYANHYLSWIYYTYFIIKRSLPYTKDYLEPDPYYDEYRGKGFVCSNDQRETRNMQADIPMQTMSRNNHEALEKIIAICKEKNILVTLYVPKILNSNLDRNFLNTIDAEKVDATMAPVYDSFFYDNYHLRCAGTVPYTLWIAEEFNRITAARK